MLVKLTYVFTARVDDKGNVVGISANRTCSESNQKEETSIMADFDRPMVIANASGIFSAAKFSVSITNGMLASVNAEPTQKLSDVLTATATLVKEAGALAAPVGAPPSCNSSPILKSITRATILK